MAFPDAANSIVTEDKLCDYFLPIGQRDTRINDAERIAKCDCIALHYAPAGLFANSIGNLLNRSTLFNNAALV